ncbi:ER membrane protein complex subunit 4 [Platysternon megacephalum]|uniref:ER membrane protein complex subunit 4 n=1 Tax=Platysternon megacephalum TaxID=55544 RepID=A0A4D9DY51_9SAUR|nr:ER membrane protein complex subunit 4 [Platysternon megacephalum]
MENEPKNLGGTVSSEKENAEEKNKAFQGLLSKLKLQEYQSTKLRLRDVLEIGSESIENWIPQMLGDLPWHFLRKLMALNGTARNTSLVHRAYDDDEGGSEEAQIASGDVFSFSDTDNRVSLHPLDVLCAVLLCSDSFLQQEILSKMSVCQFALPLLLPALDTPKCTLMLWAMRDIVRKWRPHSLAESRGFREESLVLTSLPTVSFVRLGSCSFSKSQLLNEVLSPSQQHHDFFIHRDMDSGNVPREITDGLVEISWYFPAGREKLDLFPEPIAVTNLRGDIESHWLQFSFLTVVSSAVFIVTESISERQYALLSSLQGSATKYYFILNCKNGNPKETLGFLNKLVPVLNLNKSQLLVKDSTTNNAGFVQKLKSAIKSITSSPPERINLEAMAVTARELGIQVDEDRKECQSATKRAREITVEIKDVAKYKREMLRLQGDLWEKLAKVEKELCRMRRQGETATEDYKCQLREKRLELRRQQNQCDLTDGLIKFVNGIEQLPSMEKHYFLKWVKFSLDHIARDNLFKLRDQYKGKSKMAGDDRQALAMLDKLISTTSLGVEHFMRELGQFYEAECSMVKEGDKAESQRQFIHLPGIAADLMLDGMKKEYLDSAWIKSRKQLLFIGECETAVHTEELAKSLIDEGKRYTEEKVNSKVDYDEIYCRELLNIINKRLQQEDVKKLGITACFEVDLKHHILGKAAWRFQKMHEDFIKQNDPQCRLEKLKPQYFSIFTDLYLEKDENQTRARDFCDQCLKPALVVYINKRLGIEIVDDILNKAESIEYGSRTFFQFTVQKKLLEEMNFDNYVKYIKNYEKFVKTWIQRRMMDQYRETECLGELEKKILSTIVKKVRDVLESSKNEKNTTVLAFVNNFCEALQQDLVISKDNLLGIQFKNTAKTGQFCANIQTFLLDLEQEILSQFGGLDIQTKLSKLSLKPQDEIFKQVFGCGKQCPFCKVPCEAGGSNHKEHFASVHRPQGLCNFRDLDTQKLVYNICSSEVVSENSFRNSDTKGKFHPYKDYRVYYPDWRIQSDPSIEASDYWKFVFQKLNRQLAESTASNVREASKNQIPASKSLQSKYRTRFSTTEQQTGRREHKSSSDFTKAGDFALQLGLYISHPANDISWQARSGIYSLHRLLLQKRGKKPSWATGPMETSSLETSSSWPLGRR